MAKLKAQDPGKQVQLAKDLGIDPRYVLANSLRAEHTGADKDVRVTWESSMMVPLEEFNEAMRRYYT
jgi:hypothetical protein